MYRPLGDYMYRVVHRHRGTSRRAAASTGWSGSTPTREQTWAVYARSVLAFSAVSILFLYAFQRLQDHLLAVAWASRR